MDESEYDDAAMEELIQRELDALDETDLEVDEDVSDLEMEEEHKGAVDNYDGDVDEEEKIDPCMSEYLSLIKMYNDEAVQRMAETEDIINAMGNINFNTDELLREKLYEELDNVDKDRVMQVWKQVCVDIDLQELEDENGDVMNENDRGSAVHVIKTDDIQEIQELETNAQKALQDLLNKHHLAEEKSRLLEEEKKKEAEKFDVLMKQRQEAKRKELEDLHVIFEKDNDILNNVVQDTLQINEVHSYEQDMKEKLEVINRNCCAEKGRLQSLQDEMVQITTTKKNWAATTIQKYFKRYIIQKIYASELKQINAKMLSFRKEKVNKIIKEQERVQAEYKRKQEDQLKKKENERLEKERKKKEKEERIRSYEEQKTILAHERAKTEQEQKRKQEEQIRKKENEKLEKEQKKKEEEKKEQDSTVTCNDTTALVTNNKNDTKEREPLSVVGTHSESIFTKESGKENNSENKKGNDSTQPNSQTNLVHQEEDMNSQVLEEEVPGHVMNNNNKNNNENSQCDLLNEENNISTQLNCQIDLLHQKNNISGQQNCQNISLIKKEQFLYELESQGNPLNHDGDSLSQDGDSLTQNGDSLTQNGDSLTQDGNSLCQVDPEDQGNYAHDQADFPHTSNVVVNKGEVDEEDLLKASKDIISNKATSGREIFSSLCDRLNQMENNSVSNITDGGTDNSTSHCGSPRDIVVLSSNLSNLDVKEEEISETRFGLDSQNDNFSPPAESRSGSIMKSEDNLLDTNERSLDDMIERISAKRKDRYAKRLAAHAIKIQSVYRGYRVRRAYKEIKQVHCGNVSSGDSDHSDSLYDEVNLDEFELNDSIMEWTAPIKPQLPSAGLPLPNVPAAIAPVQIPVKEAWCPPEGRVEVHSSHSSHASHDSHSTRTETLTEKPPRNRSAASSCKSLSKKANKISDDWGFQNEATAELMLKRAKKLGMGKRKKINSSQRYQLFKDTDSTATSQTKHVSSGRKKPPERISYFQASHAVPSPLDQKQHLESQEATYRWVCNQPVLHSDRALEVMSRNAKYFTEIEALAVQNKHVNQHGREATVLPQIDPAILAGKPLSLVQSEIHNPKPPSNARTSSGSEKGHKSLVSEKKAHSAPIRDPNLKKVSWSTSEVEEKWTHCAYR